MNTEILLPIPSVWGCVTGAMKGAGVSGFIESMYIMCPFKPLAGVRPLHFIFLGSGVILVICGKKEERGNVSPLVSPL